MAASVMYISVVIVIILSWYYHVLEWEYCNKLVDVASCLCPFNYVVYYKID